MQAFSYTASIKLIAANGKMAAFEQTYPGVSDLSVVSREFGNYNECITSCRQLMDDMKAHINQAADKPIFKISSEVNPVYSGTATISKDWAHHEVSRIWIFDEAMEKTGQIHAVGQARVFQTDTPITLAQHS